MKLKTFFFLLSLSLFINAVNAAQLKPFTTDGCSLFPDGTLENETLWLECCIKHDFAYWKGGTYEQRLQADKELKQCVASLGEEDLAALMYAGVRLGGSPYSIMDYRWGYGWSPNPGYRSLSENERELVESRLPDDLPKNITSSID
ncbi:MAG: hypothetical protein HUJ29_07850 [Gammaproteobacteria bacterium]|nr:hypothetical protein [Gammaproteobacteria bacterium]